MIKNNKKKNFFPPLCYSSCYDMWTLALPDFPIITTEVFGSAPTLQVRGMSSAVHGAADRIELNAFFKSTNLRLNTFHILTPKEDSGEDVIYRGQNPKLASIGICCPNKI